MYATERDGHWGPAKALAAEGIAHFSSVSCTTPDDCSAVGAAAFADGNQQLIYADEAGGTWSSVMGDLVSGGGAFGSVSCGSEASCSAVGVSFASGDMPIYATSVPVASVAR